jgi:hypothetical protein
MKLLQRSKGFRTTTLRGSGEQAGQGLQDMFFSSHPRTMEPKSGLQLLRRYT